MNGTHVIETLGKTIGNLHIEIAVRDAQIEALKAQLDQALGESEAGGQVAAAADPGEKAGE